MLSKGPEVSIHSGTEKSKGGGEDQGHYRDVESRDLANLQPSCHFALRGSLQFKEAAQSLCQLCLCLIFLPVPMPTSSQGARSCCVMEGP